MQAIDTMDDLHPNGTQTLGLPIMSRKHGRVTYEVYVHFSKTSTETMNDKIMRLIRNDIKAGEVS